MNATHSLKRLTAALYLAAGLLGTATAYAEAGPTVTERGQGPAMVFIPGLNSGADTFTDTCAAFEKEYRCVLIELPGFAGQPAMPLGDSYLRTMRDAIIRTLRERGEAHTVLVGHSLGGVLSMMIALEAPDLVDKLVLVESFPFAAANQNPALTAEQTRMGAERMRQMREAMTEEQYQANAVQTVGRMTRDPQRQEELKNWVHASDRTTTISALVELMVTDLREPIAALKQPVLVLGAWAAYADYGSTLDNIGKAYAGQFAKAPSVEIHMSEAGYHFLTWDDSAWVNAHIRDFVTVHDTTYGTTYGTTKAAADHAPKVTSK